MKVLLYVISIVYMRVPVSVSVAECVLVCVCVSVCGLCECREVYVHMSIKKNRG